MNRIVTHVRHNVVAYLALFVALGGTSYAAASLPRNSVGAPQLRNHSITEVKLNERSIAASVKAWVKLQWRGSRIVAAASSSRVTVGTLPEAVVVQWTHRKFAPHCVTSVTATTNVTSGFPAGSIVAQFAPAAQGGALIRIFGFEPNGTAAAQAADVLVICP